MQNEIRELNVAEFDVVSGGVNGYKECVVGSKAGGPGTLPQLHPLLEWSIGRHGRACSCDRCTGSRDSRRGSPA